jgi:hypothetical protein
LQGEELFGAKIQLFIETIVVLGKKILYHKKNIRSIVHWICWITAAAAIELPYIQVI